MKNEERIFMIFLLLILLLMVVLGSGYDARSKILPMSSGIFSALIVAFLLIMSFSSQISSWYQKFEKRSVLTESVLSAKEKKRELSIIAWFSGCTVAIYFLGFLVATPLFLFLFLKIWAKESWRLSLALAAAVPGIVYFTFVYILSVPLHTGLF
jgi:hypothetical protein